MRADELRACACRRARATEAVCAFCGLDVLAGLVSITGR